MWLEQDNSIFRAQACNEFRWRRREKRKNLAFTTDLVSIKPHGTAHGRHDDRHPEANAPQYARQYHHRLTIDAPRQEGPEAERRVGHVGERQGEAHNKSITGHSTLKGFDGPRLRTADASAKAWQFVR